MSRSVTLRKYHVRLCDDVVVGLRRLAGRVTAESGQPTTWANLLRAAAAEYLAARGADRSPTITPDTETT